MPQGIDILVYVGTTKVGGQRNATLNRDSETIDETTKDSGGWMEFGYGNRSWSIDCDGLLVESDAGFSALETAFNGKNKVTVKFEITNSDATKKAYTGTALITSFPIEAPYDDDATYSVTFTGSGALT